MKQMQRCQPALGARSIYVSFLPACQESELETPCLAGMHCLLCVGGPENVASRTGLPEGPRLPACSSARSGACVLKCSLEKGMGQGRLSEAGPWR